MMNCFGDQLPLLEPSAGLAVQFRDEIWARLLQALAQHVHEEVMVTIPAPLVVQRNHEQVGALETLQCRLPISMSGNGVAQGSTHPIKDGGFEQEGTQLFRLAS